MERSSFHPGFALPAVLLLAGCGTVYEGKYAFGEGWRKAEVVRIGAASQISRPDFFECIRKASPEQRANGQFAILEYMNMGAMKRRALPLAPEQQLQVGAKVYANMDRCDGRIERRRD